MHDDAAEAEEGDEVRYRHEGVHAVGNVPYQSETDYASYEDTGDVEHSVAEHQLLAAQVLHASFSIVAPSQGGAEGEGGESEGEQRRTDVRYLAEGCLGEGGSIVIVDVRVGDDAGGNHQSGQGADHHGVPEGSGG